MFDIDGMVQDGFDSSALATELRPSCTNPVDMEYTYTTKEIIW